MKNKNAKKEEIRKKSIYKIVTIAIIFAIAIYIIAMICGLIIEPTNIFVVDNGKISLEEDAIGYIIREETVLQGNNYKNGMVRIIAEGERVQAGAPIFRYYSNNEENLINKIEELDVKINEAMSQENNIYPSDIKVLDNKIEEELTKIYKENDLAKIEEIKKEIEKAVSKKATITGEQSPAGSYVKKLINERASYEHELNSGTEDVKAKNAGLVSYKVDGLEEVLTPTDFSNLSSKVLNDLNLKTGQTIQTSEECGKVINNFKFYIATILESKKAKEVQVGDTAKIKLSSQEELSCKVNYIIDEDDGTRIIVFETSSYSEQLISYRKVSIDVVWWSDEGLKIPKSALIKEGELYYVTRNRAGYLDKILVKLLRQNENYAIVDSYDTDELKELGFSQSEIINMKTISIYDEILVNK